MVEVAHMFDHEVFFVGTQFVTIDSFLFPYVELRSVALAFYTQVVTEYALFV